jgi:hypothetical protein
VTLYRIDRRSYLFAAALVLVALLLPACAGSEEETVGETPPTILVAEHPVTSEAARRAGIVDDGVVDEGMVDEGMVDDVPAAEGPSLDAPAAGETPAGEETSPERAPSEEPPPVAEDAATDG